MRCQRESLLHQLCVLFNDAVNYYDYLATVTDEETCMEQWWHNIDKEPDIVERSSNELELQVWGWSLVVNWWILILWVTVSGLQPRPLLSRWCGCFRYSVLLSITKIPQSWSKVYESNEWMMINRGKMNIKIKTCPNTTLYTTNPT